MVGQRGKASKWNINQTIYYAESVAAQTHLAQPLTNCQLMIERVNSPFIYVYFNEILYSFCKDQHTALTLARHNGHLELSKLLEEYSRRGW